MDTELRLSYLDAILSGLQDGLYPNDRVARAAVLDVLTDAADDSRFDRYHALIGASNSANKAAKIGAAYHATASTRTGAGDRRRCAVCHLHTGKCAMFESLITPHNDLFYKYNNTSLFHSYNYIKLTTITTILTTVTDKNCASVLGHLICFHHWQQRRVDATRSSHSSL